MADSSPGIPRIVLALIVIDVLLVVCAFIDFLAGSPFERVRTLVDLDGEATVQAWFSSAQWLMAGLLMGLFALSAWRARLRGTWSAALLAVAFIAFSLDEIAGIHEWLGWRVDVLLPGGHRSNTLLWHTGLWPFLLGIPVLIALAVLVIRVRHVFVPRAPAAFRLLIVGLIVMFTGALAVELASNIWPREPHNRGWIFAQVALEESLEMLGVSIIIWSALELLRAYGFAVHVPTEMGARQR